MLSSIVKMLVPSFMFRGVGVVAGMAGAAAIGAVGSGMAAKSASKGAASAAEAANSPWKAAQPYISGEFGHTQDALHGALDMGTYGGPRVADMNPYQTTGANLAGEYAVGHGASSADQLYGAGSGMVGAGANYGSNAQSLFEQANGDPTGSFLNTANQYANNPYVDGLIDSNSRDITRNLYENQLPSLALGAAGSGNTNSTRTGVESAIMQRGAADRLADVSNNIRSSFFNNGLQMAQSQYNQGIDNRLAANGQVGSAFGMGSNALLQGQEANAHNFDQAQAAGGVYAGHDQAQIDADQRAFAEQQNGKLDLYGKYMGVINGKFGGQAISSVGPSVGGSAISGAMGGAMTAAGLYNQFKTPTPAVPAAAPVVPAG